MLSQIIHFRTSFHLTADRPGVPASSAFQLPKSFILLESLCDRVTFNWPQLSQYIVDYFCNLQNKYNRRSLTVLWMWLCVGRTVHDLISYKVSPDTKTLQCSHRRRSIKSRNSRKLRTVFVDKQEKKSSANPREVINILSKCKLIEVDVWDNDNYNMYTALFFGFMLFSLSW